MGSRNFDFNAKAATFISVATTNLADSWLVGSVLVGATVYHGGSAGTETAYLNYNDGSSRRFIRLTSTGATGAASSFYFPVPIPVRVPKVGGGSADLELEVSTHVANGYTTLIYSAANSPYELRPLLKVSSVEETVNIKDTYGPNAKVLLMSAYPSAVSATLDLEIAAASARKIIRVESSSAGVPGYTTFFPPIAGQLSGYVDGGTEQLPTPGIQYVSDFGVSGSGHFILLMDML